MTEQPDKRILRTLSKESEVANAPDFMFWCPACKCGHGVWVEGPCRTGAQWKFNGNMEKPSFHPSLKIEFNREGKDMVCHLVVTDGVLNYCGDSTHELAGQSIPMEPF